MANDLYYRYICNRNTGQNINISMHVKPKSTQLQWPTDNFVDWVIIVECDKTEASSLARVAVFCDIN